MPQLPVIGYALQVQTNPPQQPGAPAAPFRVAVAVQLQPNGPFSFLPINGPDEFLAVTALLQTPGRLMFDPVGSTLEKIEP
jgi:hypothetical protein